MTGRTVFFGIFEGTALDFGVGFSFDAEVDSSKNGSPSSSSDEGPKKPEGERVCAEEDEITHLDRQA